MLVLFALCFPTNQLIVIKTYGYWSGNKKNKLSPTLFNS